MNPEKSQKIISLKSESFSNGIERTANFEGDWTLLFKNRLLNPEIKKQQLEKTSLLVMNAMKEMMEMTREIIEMSNENDDLKKKLKILLLTISAQNTKLESYNKFVENVFKMTHYMSAQQAFGDRDLEGRAKTTKGFSGLSGMGLPGTLLKERLCFDDGKEFTNHQKNIIESHEKGHGVRVYIGEQKKEIESLLEKELLGKEQDYIGKADEIIERMSELKNYFGFKGNEKFTIEHLHYARDHYDEDIGINKKMTLLINSIINKEEFLKVINTYGI